MTIPSKKHYLLSFYKITYRAIKKVIEKDEQANLLILFFPFRRLLWKRYRSKADSDWKMVKCRYLTEIQKAIQKVEPSGRDHLKRLLVPIVLHSFSPRTIRRIVKSIHDPEERENALVDWCRFILRNDELLQNNSVSLPFFKEALHHLEDENLYEELLVILKLKSIELECVCPLKFQEEELEVLLQRLHFHVGSALYAKNRNDNSEWERKLRTIREILESLESSSWERDRILLEIVKYPELTNVLALPWLLERIEDDRECLSLISDNNDRVQSAILMEMAEKRVSLGKGNIFYQTEVLIIWAKILFRSGNKKAGRDAVRRCLVLLDKIDNDVAYTSVLRRLYCLHIKINEKRVAEILLQRLREKIDTIDIDDIRTLVIMNIICNLIEYKIYSAAQEWSILIPILVERLPLQFKIMLLCEKKLSSVIDKWMKMFKLIEDPLEKATILTRVCNIFTQPIRE